MEKKILIRTAARNGLLFTKTSARVWLLLAVATLATLLLLVFPEDGPYAVLFAMNFVWLLLLETLGVGAVSALRRKRFFTAQHIAVAHQAVRFAVTGLAVAVVFNVARSVLGETLELKWYGAAIALLCAWHGAKILYMLQGAGALTEAQARQDVRVEKKREATAFPPLESAFRAAAGGKKNLSAEKKLAAERALTVFLDAAKRIPATEFSDAPELSDILAAELRSVSAALDAFSAASDAAAPDALDSLKQAALLAAQRVNAARGNAAR